MLQKQVFPVAGYASAQSLSDDRIPSAAVRQAVAKLTPIYQNCVEERHSEHLEMLDDVRKSHLAARVSLLHRLADGTLTYAGMRDSLICSGVNRPQDCSFGR